MLAAPIIPTTADYAMQMTLLGCQVFRLQPGTKDIFIDKRWAEHPLSTSFDIFEAFTTETGQCAGFNYGVNAGKSDLFVLDIDCKGGVDGFSNLATLGALPNTFMVRTPSGGAHYYFKANGRLFGQADLAPGVQVRSYHGYVVGPGSRLPNGVYEIENDAPFADLPEWLANKAKPVGERPTKPGASLLQMDTTGAIAEAVQYVKDLPVAREGGRNVACCQAARACLDRACSPEMAFEILSEHFKASPAMDPAEIEGICERVSDTYVGPKGKELAGHGFEPVTVPQTIAASEDDEFQRRLKPLGLTLDELSRMPARPWLIKNMLLRKNCSMIIAPGGTGKSVMTLNIAMALALGDGSKLGFEVKEPCKVLLVSAEDDLEELNRRIGAMNIHFGIDHSSFHGRLTIYDRHDGGSRPFRAVVKTKTGLEPSPDIQRLVAAAKAGDYGAIIIDPLIKVHTAGENDNGDMDKVLEVFLGVAQESNAAILLVHHTRKPSKADATGHAGDPDSGRGAGSSKDATRVTRTLFTMTNQDAKMLGVPPNERLSYVRLDDGKANYNARSAKPYWFRMHSVQLPNGEDDAPAMVPVQFDTAKADLERRANILNELAAHISANKRGMASNPKGKDNAVSRLAAKLCADRETIKIDLEILQSVGDIVEKIDGAGTNRWELTEQGCEWVVTVEQ